MQQRPTTSSSSRAQEADNSMIMNPTPPFQPQSKPYSPKNSASIDASFTLPLFIRSSNPFKKSSSEKLVHAIPFLVLISLFTLWWFSYPVNLVIKDSKIVAIHRVEMPESFNNHHVELAVFLASATSPVEAVHPHNFTMTENTNETEAPPSKFD